MPGAIGGQSDTAATPILVSRKRVGGVMNQSDQPEYEVPTWLLGTVPRHPFVIYHDAEATGEVNE
ncbi:hypothetical protein NJBCHELONAE_39080 [Mycobacteroides chelonae]|nr:hypothetical protein NJBCHELONAE_39080 [Mycobacteroides chelonae]